MVAIGVTRKQPVTSSPMPHQLVVYALLLALQTVDGIRVSSLVVPHQVGRGHDVQLYCNFDLSGHNLYSVKWFKGSHEFARVGARSFKIFPLQELSIDVSRSNVSTVYLENIQKSNAGTYRCEVSGEAPYFETDYREANMSVIELPLQGPIIINVQKSYQPGELVSLNCTSAPSNPTAVLQWYIDGAMVPNAYVKQYRDGVQDTWLPSSKSRSSSKPSYAGLHSWQAEDKLETVDDNSLTGIATLGLEFVITSSKTHSPTRNVTCTASVGDIYKGVTHAHLIVVDGTTTSVRPPSHLHSNGKRSGSGRPFGFFYSILCCVYSLVFHLKMVLA